MSDINNSEGIAQATKALSALERPRQQTDLRLKEEEKLALKQMISGIIPEWRETDNKRKKEVITLLRSWTGEMMNLARIRMKTWITKKNEHKASIQQRWDNRGKIHRAFQRWRKRMGHEYDAQTEGKEGREERITRDRIRGIKYWDGDRMMILGRKRQQNPRNGCLRPPEAYILASGDITIPYYHMLHS
eukprot:6174160-Pleurochrysis_carterae.AAC.1